MMSYFVGYCGSPAIWARQCARRRGGFDCVPPFSGEVTHEAMIGKVLF
jgi:hypothetical protein